MAVAVASACDQKGCPLYKVTGVDLDTPQGNARVEALRHGKFPFLTTDTTLIKTLEDVYKRGNLTATTDDAVYETADVVVIDVAFDIPFLDEQPQLKMADLEEAVRGVSRRIPEGALVIVETTVPPGTCEKIIAPIVKEESRRRGLGENAIHLAHSPERVMPGAAYLESITRFWRVYAGQTREAAQACEVFLSTIVDVENFSLVRMASMTASETVKVMENTYRAVNIAFIDEWTKYAEKIGIDLYEVIDAIRVRPTHSNIRFPGLGVGGYCLTKDPAFAPATALRWFGGCNLEFPFSRTAMKINQAMPAHTVTRLESMLGGSCEGKSILVLGISYRQDVGDTRYSPVETLFRALEGLGAHVTGYDPFLNYWPEMDRSLPSELPAAKGFDAIVIGTPHREFIDLDLPTWLEEARPIVLDTANIVAKVHRQRCRKVGIRIESIGRGDGL